MKRLLPCLAALLLAGCVYLPLKPGHSHVQLPDGGSADVVQSQNPKEPSEQTYEQTGTNGVTTKITTKIGAAQKDAAREIAAKLASLKGIVWVGVLVFLFGVASAFYPPLKLLVGSVTTSVVLAAAGLALIILPTLVVGNEILILSVALGAAGLYWFAHRHGGLRGELSALKTKLEGK